MLSNPRDRVTLTRPLLGLLAVATGVGVANIYYAQPLAAVIGAELHATAAEIGAALTSTQAGYALGMLLLVPLGDGRERRSMIVATAGASVVALLLVAGSRSIAWLIASSLLVGVGSSVVQMIVPYAVSLAPSQERGRVVGGVMAGLLTGILLSRTVSGALGAVLGWRAVYVLAAIAMAGLTLVLRFATPPREPDARLPWTQLLRSLFTVFASEPVLRRRALVGACGMASFSIFWSMLSFHLEAQGYGSAVAGTFGVVGVVGVFVAPLAARRAVGANPGRINLAGLSVVALSFLVFALGARSILALGAGVVLLDAGVQASHLTNQTVIFGLRPELQSRANALYMVSYFAGGAFGTTVGSLAWSHGGWPLVCGVGALFALLGTTPLLSRRSG